MNQLKQTGMSLLQLSLAVSAFVLLSGGVLGVVRILLDRAARAER